MKSPSATPNESPRRSFLKASAITGGALLADLDIARFAHAAGSDEVKIALVGCGGRGTGAAANSLGNTTHGNIRLIARADAFRDRLDSSCKTLETQFKQKVDVSEAGKFVGLDAYKGVLESEADTVLLVTPPGFRPMMFEAAVKAGKNVFMEKPVAVDAPGYRRVLAANAEAKRKGLVVAVGHHLRHATNHRNVIRLIHDGLIGELQYTRSYFNTSGIWNRARKDGMTEMQYQIHNWYHFIWLSGDHIVEQHVHGIDVCNWIAQGHPVEAVGMGGRQVRAERGVGEIFDHHAVQYTYANGVRSFSECRQIPKCWPSFSHHAHGSKGYVSFEGGNDNVTIFLKGKEPQRLKGGPDGHQTEWDDLLAGLRARQPYNEVDWAADSTMSALLGRMATYSGRLVTWDDAVKSELTYAPGQLAWDAEPKSRPGPDGIYPCAIPGVTKAF
ncbi:MAG: Gfo/Idh/MocA family oxidoreductase [Verrucomicrobia bacterium]|nr:Gfo/Idh/MocA family oxidoreductase [Verrucomicrobiota bacterium]